MWSDLAGDDEVLWIYDAWFESGAPLYSRVAEVGIGAGRSLAYAASRVASRLDIAISGIENFADQDAWQAFVDGMAVHARPELGRVVPIWRDSATAAKMNHDRGIHFDLVVLNTVGATYAEARDVVTAWRRVLTPSGWLGGRFGDACVTQAIDDEFLFSTGHDIEVRGDTWLMRTAGVR